MKWHRLMAVAARSGQLGVVCLVGRDLLHWEMTVKYARTPKLVRQYMEKLINLYEPDVFVSEEAEQAFRKAPRTRKVLTTLALIGEDSKARAIKVERIQRHPNKQIEAAQIAKRHPALSIYVPPPRRVFDDEPRAYVLFEAIALAEEALLEDGF